MSNRTIEQANFAAELKASHLAQIEALTAPGLTDEERIERFADAAEFGPNARNWALDQVLVGDSAAFAVWSNGHPQKSLFANLPGCCCPVIEAKEGHRLHRLIPTEIPCDWSPDRVTLEAFARVQQEARLK